MSKFIPKKTLTEGMASNPLDAVQSVSNDVTKKAQEAILTAVAAETDAINQYSQILDLIKASEPWLDEIATSVIEDIIAEEKKHLGQLTELVSNLPGYEEDFKAGEKETETGKDENDSEEKEEVEESVSFDIKSFFNILSEEGINIPESLFEYANSTNDTLTAVEIDTLLETLDPEALDKIEKRIISEAIINK